MCGTDVISIYAFVKWAALLIDVAVICAILLLHPWAHFSRNPSSGSGLSETGSLDRAKAALERRKKASEEGVPQARVEVTRVNPDSLIDEILRSTNLEPHDESGTSNVNSSCKDTGILECKKRNRFIHVSSFCQSIGQYSRRTQVFPIACLVFITVRNFYFLLN